MEFPNEKAKILLKLPIWVHEPISCHWSLSIPLENIKPEVFCYFQGVLKVCEMGVKLV